MDLQNHLNPSVDEKDHAANVKKIEKMIKAQSEIEKSIWFNFSVTNFQGVYTLLLSRLFYL